MTFEKYLCWETGSINQIIKPDAEEVGDDVFLAVHSDQRIRISRTGLRDGLALADGTQFLETFMDPDRPDIFALVLGESGAGKSHFIHWLRLNIPEDDKVRLINIPKVGTSLRNILKTIIVQLPEAERDKYLHKLEAGGDRGLTRDLKKSRLLDSIAQAMEAKSGQGDVSDPDLAEILPELPHLFHDPQIREEWFLKERPDNIIDELVDHVFEARGDYARLERARNFGPRDFELPAGIMSRVARRTQSIINLMQLDESYKTLAAEAVNYCLDAAISDALSFSSDNLIDLMTEIREYLYSQGASLIVLIEDLSRLQGVDTALLQALTTPSGQHGRKLCSLRWAAALTSGYYDRLEETVRSRIKLLAMVQPDEKLWESRENKKALAGFASRYLNAVRAGTEKLHEWRSANTASTPPNRCLDCLHVDMCHRVFGASNGMGLYPFTEDALIKMSRLVAFGEEPWFNPRRILKNVVIPVMSAAVRDILYGNFPPHHLREDMNGQKFGPIILNDLRRLAGQDFERHWTLQELYSLSDKIVAFPKPMLIAFGLEELDLSEEKGPEEEEDQIIIPEPGPLPDPVPKALDDWGQGRSMSDMVANRIRPIIFEAIEDHIDWDGEGLEKTAYFGRTGSKPFRQTSLVFFNQITSSNAPLTFNIPEAEGREVLTNATIALKGFYLFNRHKTWTFPDGPKYLVHVQEHLDQWAKSVVKTLKEFPQRGEKWDVIDGATELLAVGAALTGTIGADSSESEIWGAMWGAGSGDNLSNPRSLELRTIVDAIGREWKTLQGEVKAWHAGTKGGQAGNHLNPTKPFAVLARLVRNNWSLAMRPEPGNGPHKVFNDIKSLYLKVSRDLVGAIEAEIKHHVDWLKTIKAAFGETDRDEIVKILKGLRRALEKAGEPIQGLNPMTALMDNFAKSSYLDAKRKAAGYIEKKKGGYPPTFFGHPQTAEAMRVAQELARSVGDFLNREEQEFKNRLTNFSSQPELELEKCWSDIEDLFDSLDRSLGQLAVPSRSEGGDGDVSSRSS